MDLGAWQGAERATGNLLNIGMQLQNNQANQQLRQDEINMRREQMQNVSAYQDKQLANDEKRIAIEQMKVPASQQPFNNSKLTKAATKLKLGGVDPMIVDNFIGQFKPLADDPNVNTAEAATAIEQTWAMHQKGLVDNYAKSISKLTDQVIKLDPNDPQKPKLQAQIDKMLQQQQAFESIKQEQVVPFLFPSYAQERENTKAALAAANPPGQPDQIYLNAQTTQYIKQGKTPQEATIAAYKDLSKIQADKVRAGRTVNQFGSGLGSPSGLLPGKPGEINESALAGLNAAQAATVKKIANYELPPSNYRSKDLAQLLQRAALYDPTYNAAEYNTKSAVRKDFTSGKASQTILSLNTAVGHLNSLAKAADELDNGSVQSWNTFRNALTTKLTDDSRVTKFNTVANAVAGELATVFKNTSGTDQEIKSWHDKISSSQTPGQLKANIQECIQLIGSRLDALNNKYEQGMGKKMDFQILSPKSRQILTGLGVDVNQFDPASSQNTNPQQPNPPQGRGGFIYQNGKLIPN